MNKRLGLEGERKVGIDILAKRDISVPSGSGLPATKRDGIRFDKAHQDAFKKMDSIASHYAAKRPSRDKNEPDGIVPGTNKRKSEALGADRPRRVPGAVKKGAADKVFSSGSSKKTIPGGFGNEDEEEDRRMSKRPRVADNDKAEETEAAPVKDEETMKKAREAEAVRRKAEARRRSSRVHQGVNTGLARQSTGRGRTSVANAKKSEPSVI